LGNGVGVVPRPPRTGSEAKDGRGTWELDCTNARGIRSEPAQTRTGARASPDERKRIFFWGALLDSVMTRFFGTRRRRTLAPAWTRGIFAALLFLLLGTTHTGLAHEGSTEALFDGAELLFAPYVESPTSTQDGILSANEYDELGRWEHEDEGFQVYLEQDGTWLYVGMANGLGGWAAFGLGEGDEFDVKVTVWNGTAGFAEDRYIPILTDELETVADTSQDGTEDIQGFAASLEGGVATSEFRVLLAPEDSTDVALESGAVHRSFVVFGTTGQPPSGGLTDGDAHFLRVYALRSTDNPAEIYELLVGAPPADGLAIAIVVFASLGILALVWQLLGKRRQKE